MNDTVHRANLNCPTCGSMLLVKGDCVFCQVCHKRVTPQELNNKKLGRWF